MMRRTFNRNTLKIVEVFLGTPAGTPLVGMDIALETGLAQPTVSQILVALRDAEWIRLVRQTGVTPQNPWKPYVMHERTRAWLLGAVDDLARLTGV